MKHSLRVGDVVDNLTERLLLISIKRKPTRYIFERLGYNGKLLILTTREMAERFGAFGRRFPREP